MAASVLTGPEWNGKASGKMMIPPWLVQLGSMAGLFTLGFTFFDRLLSGRPIISLAPSEYGKRNVRCFNPSQSEIIINSVHTFPRCAKVAKNDSTKGIIRAARKQNFRALCAAAETRDFPLVFLNTSLMDTESTRHAPFIIVLTWRKTRSLWLPQFPVFLVTSARSIRILNSEHEA